MLQLITSWLQQLNPWQALGLGCLALLLATQVVIWVLDRLEKHRFGSVQLGTLITPLCTGFPNLMIGLFGQAQLEGDLIIQLNIGNNIANTSLVTGLLLLVAGPLLVRPAKGISKKAKRENRGFAIALSFLWLGMMVLIWVSRDGRVTRLDGAALIGVFALSQLFALRERGKVTKKQRLGKGRGALMLLGLAVAALVIQQGVALVSQSMEKLGDAINMQQLGLLMGLLTVFPECFLMLRLAMRKGSLGISGLVGDCLVSIPLVVGLSALLNPVPTGVLSSWRQAESIPYIALTATMIAFSGLSFRKTPVSRWMGLLFIGLYAMVWWLLK